MVKNVSLRVASRVLLTVAGFCVAGQAMAHAHLESAQPPVDGRVAQVPERLQIRFTEKLEPALTTVSVKNAAGESVDDGKPQVSATDARELTVGIKQPLAAGVYTVDWAITSVDTHRTKGQYKFTVSP